MKKKFLVLISLLLTGSLVACGGPGGGGGDASSGGNNQSGGNGDNSISLPNTAEEAQNKLLQLAKSQGFEITFLSNGEEDGTNNGPESMTLGYKSDVLWVVEEAAYKKVDSKIELYDYNTNSKSYEFQAEMSESEQFSLEQTLKQVTAAFYIGYEIALNPQNTLGYISSEKSVTFNGRAAKEYTYSYRGLEGAADLKLVFDNETGITLKVEGSASSSDGSFSTGTYEVTSFKTGSAVTVPTLVKNSGGQQGGEGGGQQGGEGGGQQGGGQQGGGQGEQGEVSKFENKEFVYVSNQNYNIFVGSKLCLFQDGSFELSFTDGGALVVYLGNYTVNEAGTLAYLTPVKVYKAKANQYSNLTEATMWNFRYDSDDAYVLLVNASSSVTYKVTNNQPMRADIPDDPNGGAGQGDEKYIVSQAQWEAILLKNNLVNMSANFSARVPNLYLSGSYTTYEFDNGKVHILTTLSGSTNEQYAEFTSNEVGYSYYQSNGNWVKQESPISLDYYNDDLGLLPVPFSTVSYSSEMHCYSCREWKDENQDYYTSIRFYFENGNLMKMTYTHWGTNYEHEFYKYGSTSVTIPTVASTDPTDYYSAIENKVFSFKEVTGFGDDEEKALANQTYAGSTVQLFADRTMEFNVLKAYNGSAVIDYPMTQYGTYNLFQYNVDGYVRGNAVFTASLRNGVYSTHEAETYPYRYYISSGEIRVQIEEGAYLWFSKTNQTPTPTAHPDPVTPPSPEANWPAEDIATKLSRLGFNVTIPAPSADNDANISSVVASPADDNSALTIIVTANSVDNATLIFSDFTSLFNTAFTVDMSQSSATAEIMSFAYLNASKDVKINLIYVIGSSYVTIIVSEYSAANNNPFPADAIATFFRTNEINASFPDLTMDNVSYSFNDYGDEGYLTLGPTGENTCAAVLEAVETLLLRAGLKVCYAVDESGSLQALYFNSDFQYYVMLMEYSGSVYVVISVVDDSTKDMFSLSYPEQFLRNAIPAGTRDNLPSFAVEGATYMFGEFDGGCGLIISMQQGMVASRSLSALKDNLTNAGYHLTEDESAYISANGHIMVSLEVIDDVAISVGIYFLYEEADVTYTFIFDANPEWDFGKDGAQIYIYVWDNQGNYEWIAAYYDDETKTITFETTDRWIGCKIVRFADYSEIGWKYGPEGSVNEGVEIWNETGDIALSGQSGEIHFSVN